MNPYESPQCDIGVDSERPDYWRCDCGDCRYGRVALITIIVTSACVLLPLFIDLFSV